MSNTSLILHQSRSLYLRRVELEDVPLLFEKMYSNPELMHLVHLNSSIQSEVQLRQQVAQRLKFLPSESGCLECMVIHKTHGAIGAISAVNYVPFHGHAEIVIAIFDDYRYTGYGSEAFAMMLDLLFNAYHLHRVYTYAYSHNHFSQKTMRAAGFIEEGVMQDHLFDRTTQQFVNLHIFGMTIDQFRQNQRIARITRRLIGRDITQPLVAPPVPPVSSAPPEIVTPTSLKPTFVKSGAVKLKPKYLTKG
ncbi:MAG TPA: GNAT family N-acetyltransferase [Allocoleopsis sp.]